MKFDIKNRILELLLEGWDASGKSKTVSGEKISKELGISRVMVNRYIRELMDEGFIIEAKKYKGYRVINIPDVIYPSVIRLKYTGNNEFKFIIFDEISSTNTYCLENAKNLEDRTVVIANHQTQGKGRFGRSWYSENSKDITMSILLKPNIHIDEVVKYTMSASIAVLEALRNLDIDNLFIKWPNDIMYNDRKLCGILVETILEYTTGLVETIVIGIGLNVNSSPSRIIPTSTSVYEILGFEVKRYSLIGMILSNFDSILQMTYNSIFTEWKKNIGYIGKRICVKYGDVSLQCTLVDVSRTGEIIVDDNNTIKKFSFGEVSLIV